MSYLIQVVKETQASPSYGECNDKLINLIKHFWLHKKESWNLMDKYG